MLMKLTKGLFSVLYLVRQFDLNPRQQDAELEIVLDEPPFTLAQEPNEKEIRQVVCIGILNIYVKITGMKLELFCNHLFKLNKADQQNNVGN